MRKISLLTSGLLILVLAATGRCQTQGSVAELPKITGTWDVVGGEIEGQRLNEVKLAGTRIVVEGDMIRLTSKNAKLNFVALVRSHQRCQRIGLLRRIEDSLDRVVEGI